MSTKNTAPAETTESVEATAEETTPKAKRAPRASTVERLEQALIDAKAKETARAERRIGAVRGALEAAEQLEEHARLYVAAVRAASRAEESMEALGMVFTRPPWRMP